MRGGTDVHAPASDRVYSDNGIGQVSALVLSVRIWSVRAVSARRACARIVREEPVWFAVVCALSLIGIASGVPRLVVPGGARVAVGVAALLAYLLEATRPDERLLAVVGANRVLVRLVDAFLWLSPLLALLVVRAPQGALGAVLAIAGISFLPARRGPVAVRSSRAHSQWSRLLSLGATEWVAGLRRTPWVIAASMVAGVLGSAQPIVAIASLAVGTLSVTAYHWTPSEGWLLIHVGRRRARAYIWHKVGTSCGLLVLCLAPILVSAVVRSPSLAPVFGLSALACIHAHACGILCKYATYEEGAPLSPGGTLIWLLVSAMIALPPSSFMALYLLERRAEARLAPFCDPVPAVRKAIA
ncbi:MAG: hypothetical protein JWM95_385 [Gemmatimonadetes bacterium]|nr:hypothetical protein [Gemmatimonadota bacterium]